MDRARVLFESINKFHPEWDTFGLITDELKDGFFLSDKEPFKYKIFSSSLKIENFRSWIFKHNIVEACTAVKGPFLKQLMSSSYDAVIYLDPDTCLFSKLNDIIQQLNSYSIILTPHQLSPDNERRSIIDNEICSLKTGIYNLGFLAVRNDSEGKRFSDWWSDRLINFCYDDIVNGLFVDQRWCDHIPSFFERVLINKDPGLNVASWNLSGRELKFNSHGNLEVNGHPLKFWHFTKLGSIGDLMTRRYAKNNTEVYEVWDWYKRKVSAASDRSIKNYSWFYGTFDDGKLITDHQRLVYRKNPQIHYKYIDPYLTGDDSYQSWYFNNHPKNQVI